MIAPSGTVTFLFTDIVGSTKLWELHPEAMQIALAQHDLNLRSSIERNRGYVFKTVGDAFCAAFSTAPEALTAAVEAHTSLIAQEWGETGPIRVRIGLHTGGAEIRDGDYFGQTLNRVARLQSIAYGGQTLLSQATYELVRDHLPSLVTLNPMGLHRLKDLNRAEQVYQAAHPDLPSEFPPLRSLDSLPNNLPIQLTSFVGREQEMEELRKRLGSHRLVTLLGPGGTGKTRLSMQVSAELLEKFPDGVWFIELAPLIDAAQVAQAIAGVLGVKETAGIALEQALIETLKSCSTLLILDNCEHLLLVCAKLAHSLLQSCPHLNILASSREGLNVLGESTYRVPSLSLPDAKAVHSVESLTQFEAVRLFVDRAVSIQDSFAVTNQNAPALADLCARLDGIPLAIELAAARIRSLSVEEINGRLDNCFRLLTGGSRTALPRQQTLRALIDWSYDMLLASEKALLRRLSVFSGGWTLAAAEIVCLSEDIEDWEILDLLTALVDKSLVVAGQTQGQTRYRLLETIRQYSRDRLMESGESAAVAERHFHCFLDFAKTASTKLSGAEEQTALQQIDQDYDNLRCALDWAIENRLAKALECAVALGNYWYLRGFLRMGRDYLERALANPVAAEDVELNAEACLRLGRLSLEQGDNGPARSYLERALHVSRQSGNTRRLAAALNSLATIDFRQERYGEARARYEEALELQASLVNKQGMAAALSNLGTVLRYQNELDLSRERYDQSLALYREGGNKRGEATVLLNLGNAFTIGKTMPWLASIWIRASPWRENWTITGT